MERHERVSEKMRRALSEFPQAERKVARALLSGVPTMGLESSSRVAEIAGVSGPTVIRFVNRLGFATYAEFQQAVHDELEFRFASPVDLYPARHSEDGAEAADQIAERYSSTITETFSRLPSKELDAAAAILGNSRLRVRVFGGWFSHALARHLTGLLQEIRPDVQFVDNSPQRRAPALVEADNRCAAVFFDFRRYEMETEKLGRAMSAQGSRIVLFTDQWLSPLADAADVVLPASVGDAQPFESYVAPLAVVETVVRRIVDADLNGMRERFEHFNEVASELSADTRGVTPAAYPR